MFVCVSVLLCSGLVFVCRNDCAGHQADGGAEILRSSLCLHFSAPFFWIVIVSVHGTQSSKNRCRTNSHSTRMMVGRYICHLIRFTDSFTESVALESSEE